MSIKDLLDKPFKAVGVRLKDLGQSHRHAPESIDLGAMPLKSRIGDLIGAVRDVLTGPNQLSTDKSIKALEEFIDTNAPHGFKDELKVELTKQWLAFNHRPADLVAVSVSNESGMDSTVVSFVLSQAMELPVDASSQAIAELSARVLDYDSASADPKSATLFASAVPRLFPTMPNAKWIAADLVNLYSQSAHWEDAGHGYAKTSHKDLRNTIKEQLVTLGLSPRQTVLLEVARCPDVDVQKAVRSTAVCLGEIDPGLREKIEAVCEQHKTPEKTTSYTNSFEF